MVPTLVYKTNEVDLTFAANTISSQLPAGSSANQLSTASGIDSILATGKAPSQFVNLFGLTPTGVAGALTQLDGELGSSVTTTLLQSSENFLETLLDTGPDHADAGGGAAPAAQAYADAAPTIADRIPAFQALATTAPAPMPPVWSVWATATGVSTTLGADNSRGTSATSDRSAGVAVGADYRAIPGTILGFGARRRRRDDKGRELGQSANSDLFQLGVYGTTHFEQAYISGAFAYTHADTSATRAINVGGINETLTSKPHSDLVAGRIEIGRRFAFGLEGLTPYAALTVQNASTKDAFAENIEPRGAGFCTLLWFNQQRQRAHRTRFAVRFRHDRGRHLVRPARLELHQEQRPSRPRLCSRALPATAFSIRGGALPQDAGLVALTTNVALAHNLQLSATGGAELASHDTTLDGRLTIRYRVVRRECGRRSGVRNHRSDERSDR